MPIWDSDVGGSVSELSWAPYVGPGLVSTSGQQANRSAKYRSRSFGLGGSWRREYVFRLLNAECQATIE